MAAPLSLRDFPFLKDLDILPEWEGAALRFLKSDGRAMVFGAPDSGKSTLSRYLVYRAFAAGKPAALVDLDLDQSHLGPPATLGLGLLRTEKWDPGEVSFWTPLPEADAARV
jgi:polynucleotide 5'-kinase involved in rRNA processing